MRASTLTKCLMAAALGLVATAGYCQTEAKTAKPTEESTNTICLGCHGNSEEPLETQDASGKSRVLPVIDAERISKGVHSDLACTTCHTNILSKFGPHKKSGAGGPNCETCHEALWEKTKQEDLTKEKARLGIVAQNIEAYRKSFHARPNADDPSRPNATCNDCHAAHYFNVPPEGTSKRTQWHLTIPKVCGACHEEQLAAYASSVHGIEVLDRKNPKAATCTDCHTSHDIASTMRTSTKLVIIDNCGYCHQDNLTTYGDTYHGQVTKLGYAYTAKCYDCHGHHEIARVSDPKSKVHSDNRLETCRECHDGKNRPLATAGFISFGAHANTHDFARYPQMWIASKFMYGLLIFVFAYFWTHSVLWAYREYKDRQARKGRPHVNASALPLTPTKHVRRFGLIWRIGHLLFALSIMVLILTGMALFYANTAWAPVVMNALGGPQVVGIVHRVSATIMLSIFFLHLILVTVNIARNYKTFRWFGPDSLVPNWQDLKDAWNMFVWFVGKGERPVFDRWTYWMKFDYWAVFWGMAIIGSSGLLLAFPHVSASIFPGWAFNVAKIIHGEEAFLATVFLFTVHFFNNQFRPDKLPPPDIVIFTGTLPLELFKRDHAAQYQRLVETGELDRYLVDAPSAPMTLGAKILGFTLIGLGLILLVLVIIGFLG
jgi:cytochrome b subunit of formate dehydrogenase